MNASYFYKAFSDVTKEECYPLANILEVELSWPSTDSIQRPDVEKLWNQLSYYGSSDVAYILRGKEGVAYAEVVRDACKSQKINNIFDGENESAIGRNEDALIQHFFAQAWERMSEEERRELLAAMDLNAANVRMGGSAAAASIVAGELGGFATYKLAVTVANWIAKALLGRGLPLVGNALLARILGVALGPVGWVASGAWLIHDVTGPALRKTVPAVLQVAALRGISRSRSERAPQS